LFDLALTVELGYTNINRKQLNYSFIKIYQNLILIFCSTRKNGSVERSKILAGNQKSNFVNHQNNYVERSS